MQYQRLSVLIPAYNEARTIERVLAAVQAVDLAPLGLAREIIVIDDGSTDDTAAIVRGRHPDVVLVQQSVNQGKGTALRAALPHLTGDVVLIQDADLEYDPADHPALLGPIVRGEAQVVFGSRFLESAWPRQMRLPNLVANRVLTLLGNLLFDVQLTDEATCYKVFDAALLRSLPLRCRAFEFCPEVVGLLGRRRVPIREVPVRYLARTAEEGKKVGWRDGVQAVRTLVAMRLRAS